PENANDIGFLAWTTGNVDVATVNSVGDITGVGEGETEVTCSGGNFSQKIRVSVAYTRPFKGPHILSSAAPYTLPMVNFDLGGEGYAFHDNDTGNSGNLPYRADNGDNTGGAVDMENASNPNIGWTGDGEWLQYTVEVRTPGKYQVEVEEASPNSDGSFRIEVNGVDQTGTVIASNTGGWGNFGWDVVPAKLTLDEGVNKIKYYFVHGAHNIRTLRFTYVP
ncbi:MAG: carbohydrate-binding protein, partial [Dysgonamonadaceae bacterium]|nr:carbohydrate-binding protein [Dysgonamonadaceae bacterium]